MANFYGQFIGFGAGGGAPGAPGAGFSAGGTISDWSVVNTIDKHFFASDTSCGDHGDLATAAEWVGGCSSSSNGYSCGGET